jgi:hypothetical protein
MAHAVQFEYQMPASEKVGVCVCDGARAIGGAWISQWPSTGRSPGDSTHPTDQPSREQQPHLNPTGRCQKFCNDLVCLLSFVSYFSRLSPAQCSRSSSCCEPQASKASATSSSQSSSPPLGSRGTGAFPRSREASTSQPRRPPLVETRLWVIIRAPGGIGASNVLVNVMCWKRASACKEVK